MFSTHIPDKLSLGIFSKALPVKKLEDSQNLNSQNINKSVLQSLQEDIVELRSSDKENNLGLTYRTEQKAGINNQKIVYEIDQQSRKGVIKVIDIDTNKEIRQLPGENAERLSKVIGQHRSNTIDTNI